MQKKLISGIIFFHLIFVPVYPETPKSAANKSTGKKADAISSNSNSSVSHTSSGMSSNAKAWVGVKLLKYGLKYGPKSNFWSLIFGGIMGGTIVYCSSSDNKAYYKIVYKNDDKNMPEEVHIRVGLTLPADKVRDWIYVENNKYKIVKLQPNTGEERTGNIS